MCVYYTLYVVRTQCGAPILLMRFSCSTHYADKTIIIIIIGVVVFVMVVT